ncbi:receptor-like kinase TMK4 [Helianthus annuus]|uniref:receptor-like kinase TMK4 n=1 Tax=Helianthus annuus TaxID=4232 RepID=UPI001652EA8F|nr:receptor-like kinase TMK4 [Helianthus annuus]
MAYRPKQHWDRYLLPPPKSSNILLGDDFRAKVSDFGLVKLVPDGGKSIMTRVAGTFGYIAPEYAVTGKLTTKVDVFSYGVILMELLTGLMVLDNDRPEEKRYLVEWFSSIRADKEKVMAAVDFSLNANEEIFETISVVAELAGHCTAREPSQRPDMGHAVNVLAPLVEKWKPMESEAEVSCGGVDHSLPLTQMVKRWQEAEAEGKDYVSYMDLDDGKSIIPAGSANSFTSEKEHGSKRIDEGLLMVISILANKVGKPESEEGAACKLNNDNLTSLCSKLFIHGWMLHVVTKVI